MNNIISVTLGSRLLLIQDVAYERVKNYLAALTAHYHKDINVNAYIAAAEERLGNHLYEKMSAGGAFVTLNDVDMAIAAEPETNGFSYSNTHTAPTGNYDGSSFGNKKLYRNESDKKLGGVCSGLAHWMNIDPNIVRILFAVVFFGSLGTGFLIYILLWIFLPKQYLGPFTGRILFRNPDDKIFGGVASGIAAYFGKNPGLFRFAFALPMIIGLLKSFRIFHWDTDLNSVTNVLSGSFSGLFITIYIILWIVLPEAITPAEKNAMHHGGKTANTPNAGSFEQTMANAGNDLSERLTSWGNEVNESMQNLGKNIGQKGQAFSQNIPAYTRKSGSGLGQVIGMFFKVIVFVILGTLAFSLFIGFLAFLFSGMAFAPFTSYLWTSDTQELLGWGTILLFLAAPIIGLIVWLVRKIMGVKTPGNYLGWTFGGLWGLGWVCMVFFVASVSKEFKHTKSIISSQALAVPANNALVVDVSQPSLSYNSNFGVSFGDRGELAGNRIYGIDVDSDSLKLSNISVQYEKSPDSAYHLIYKKQAFGSSAADATNRAEKIQYGYQFKDSVLDLHSAYAIAKGNAFRMQNVIMIVQIPVGKKVRFTENVKDKIKSTNLDIEYKRGRSELSTLRYISDDVTYIMEESGVLKSTEVRKQATTKQAVNTKGYRYSWDEESVEEDSAAIKKDSLQAAADQGYRFEQQKDSIKTANDKKEILQEIERKQKELEDLKKKVEKGN